MSAFGVMSRHFTLEYWIDEGWYVGRLKEVSGVVSQGETLSELEENIRDAYQLVTDDTCEFIIFPPAHVKTIKNPLPLVTARNSTLCNEQFYRAVTAGSGAL
jgi:predicted RNase H-like HicB family nuclease